jgi:hypothetical protein
MSSLRLTLATLAVAIAATFTASPIATAKNGCCPPPPGKIVKFCVDDPCDPCDCPQEVCACVPCCCADCEVPCLVDCRKGLLGRKILTYKFASCNYCVEVVILRNGDAKVR